MNFKLLLTQLDAADDRYAETVAADIVNTVSEWAAKNGHADLVREWTPAAWPTEVRKYLAECIAATTEKPAEDGLLTLAEAAEILGYKPDGLRKVVKRGEIRYKQVGRGPIKFRRERLDEFTVSSKQGDVERSPARKKAAPPLTNGFPGFEASYYADSQSGSE